MEGQGGILENGRKVAKKTKKLRWGGVGGYICAFQPKR